MEDIKRFCESRNIPPQALIDVYEQYLKDALDKLEHTHHSDSYIEKYFIMGKTDDISKFKEAELKIEGAKWMRDRMNGEMCLFAEWKDAQNIFQKQSGRWYKKNEDDEYKGGELFAKSTTELLQKFRNRDL